MVSYLNDVFFHNATRDEVADLVATYPNNPGSPAGIGPSKDIYPEFKRLSAILGDWEFIFMARLFLETFPATVPAWSYTATYERGTPILGTFHGSDLPRIFYKTDDVSVAIRNLYISFVDCLDPNYYASNPNGYLTFWPTWQKKKKLLLEMGSNYTRLIRDNERAASFNYIRAHLKSLRV